MAKRRMFSLDIIDTDLFLEMPQTTRLLYYELCMRADDDGFVSSPKKIQRMVGCNEDDFRVLITKQFLIPFDTGVVVIKHWKIHNYIQKDRYKETIYLEEKSNLISTKNGSYEYMDTKCIQDGYTGKVRQEIELELGETSKEQETIYDYTEQNFGRTLTPIETEKIQSWLLLFSEEIIKYSIELAVMNNKRTFNYVDGILKNWKGCNYTTLDEIKNAKAPTKKNSIDRFNEILDNINEEDL